MEGAEIQCLSERVLSLSGRKISVCQGLPTQILSPAQYQTDWKENWKSGSVNMHPMLIFLRLTSSCVLCKIFHVTQWDFVKTSKDVMSRKPSNSKMLPFVCVTNPSTPIADQRTGENQFRSSPVDGRMETVLQLLFLNIAPLLFTALGLLGAARPSSSSPAVCLHLPLGPRGKPQTSISFHAETGLGAPKCSRLLGDDPAPLPSPLTESEFTVEI